MGGKLRPALAGGTSFADSVERAPPRRAAGPALDEHSATMEIIRCAVALPVNGSHAAQGNEPVRFGGGKLGLDMTLAQLQAR